MWKEERFDYILKKLDQDRKVTLERLSEEMNVSEDTVRRDIEALSKNGRLTKVRGGAIPHSPNLQVHSFKERIHLSEADKTIIAKKALTLLRPDQTILLDGGTTTYTMALNLPVDLPLTIITNSIPIAAALMDHPLAQVITMGGRILKSSQVSVGMEAISFLSRLHVDICFTGICSLHETYGITGTEMDETEVKRKMVECANKVVAVTTLNKMGTVELFQICQIEQVQTIITEASPETALFAPYRALGIQIL